MLEQCRWLTNSVQALAQDQRLALEQLLYSCPGLEHIKVYNYDGDTPQELRAGQYRTPVQGKAAYVSAGIRESASVIFTNFVSLARFVRAQWDAEPLRCSGHVAHVYTAP